MTDVSCDSGDCKYSVKGKCTAEEILLVVMPGDPLLQCTKLIDQVFG